MSAATRRLTKELADLQKDLPPNVEVEIPDEANIFRWTGYLTGPDTSAYKGGEFKIDITFPTEYPFKSPTVKFVTRIYHPNVTEEGALCIGLLKADAWKPSTKIDQVLRALVQLLEEPAPEDALEAQIAEIYVKDKATFTKNAQEYVKKYAGKTRA
ncbi:ubiquitin-conjugating enzyme [Meredithblackwellia eburnea MCA 4105]